MYLQVKCARGSPRAHKPRTLPLTTQEAVGAHSNAWVMDYDRIARVIPLLIRTYVGAISDELLATVLVSRKAWIVEPIGIVPYRLVVLPTLIHIWMAIHALPSIWPEGISSWIKFSRAGSMHLSAVSLIEVTIIPWIKPPMVMVWVVGCGFSTMIVSPPILSFVMPIHRARVCCAIIPVSPRILLVALLIIVSPFRVVMCRTVFSAAHPMGSVILTICVVCIWRVDFLSLRRRLLPSTSLLRLHRRWCRSPGMRVAPTLITSSLSVLLLDQSNRGILNLDWL